jgi:hypothetical protein
MRKEIRHPDKKFTNGPFSVGIPSNGCFFLSGQEPLDLPPAGERVRTRTIGCPPGPPKLP